MENYELVSQAVHVEEGALSGPVVNSERQLWSVAGYLSMVVEGVFGVQDDGRVQPKLPAALVPELFGKQRRISLEADGKRYVLERPKQVGDGLLVAGTVKTRGTTTTVQLVAAPSRCPPAPPMPMRARRRPRPYRRYDAAARVGRCRWPKARCCGGTAGR